MVRRARRRLVAARVGLPSAGARDDPAPSGRAVDDPARPAASGASRPAVARGASAANRATVRPGNAADARPPNAAPEQSGAARNVLGPARPDGPGGVRMDDRAPLRAINGERLRAARPGPAEAPVVAKRRSLAAGRSEPQEASAALGRSGQGTVHGAARGARAVRAAERLDATRRGRLEPVAVRDRCGVAVPVGRLGRATGSDA